MTVTLPRLDWGGRNSPQRALMVHGLGSSAQTCWRVMEALAEAGWSATAVDLRGHGHAPRASRYRITDFAADLAGVWPDLGQQPWDVVIGHSIGAASAVVAHAETPGWTKRLVLIDPALFLDDTARESVLANQRSGHLEQTLEDVARAFPHWHPLDVQLKVHAHRQASLYALEHAVFDNDPWDVTEWARRVDVPTLVVGADPELGSMFSGDYAKDLVHHNPHYRYHVIPGAGHSVHRDKPEATIEAIRSFLAEG